MLSGHSKTTVNVRIDKNTHEELKLLCKHERMLIGGLVDKVLAEFIYKWKAKNDSTQVITTGS
jgi:hypothetical protein